MTELDPRDRGGPAQPLLTVDGLVKHFPGKGGLFGKGPAVRAVDGVARRWASSANPAAASRRRPGC